MSALVKRAAANTIARTSSDNVGWSTNANALGMICPRPPRAIITTSSPTNAANAAAIIGGQNSGQNSPATRHTPAPVLLLAGTSKPITDPISGPLLRSLDVGRSWTGCHDPCGPESVVDHILDLRWLH